MTSTAAIAVLEREFAAWRASIVVGSRTQEHALYRPERLIGSACSLALARAGIAAPDPFASKRIEVSVDHFTESQARRCHAFDMHPETFARDSGGFGSLGLEEWEDSNVAAVWWRPSDGVHLCVYQEAVDATDPSFSGAGEVADLVIGPPIAANSLEAPYEVQVRWLWLHAQPRQLDLLTGPQA